MKVDFNRFSIALAVTGLMAVASAYWLFHFSVAVQTGKGMYTSGVMENAFWIAYPLTSAAAGAVFRYFYQTRATDFRWLLVINLAVSLLPLAWIVLIVLSAVG